MVSIRVRCTNATGFKKILQEGKVYEAEMDDQGYIHLKGKQWTHYRFEFV